MARKKKEMYPVDGHPWDRDGTPWGHQASYFSQETGEPFEKCRDIVITDYLHNGDIRPLAALFVTGEAPGPAVLTYIAGMMGAPLGEKLKDLPFELRIKGRNGNKPKDRELLWRDFSISRDVENEMASGKKYALAAVPDVAAKWEVGEQTVRDAYDKYHPRKPKGN